MPEKVRNMPSHSQFSSVLERFVSVGRELAYVHRLLYRLPLTPAEARLRLPVLRFAKSSLPSNLHERARYKDLRTAFHACAQLVKGWIAHNIGAVLDAEIEFEIQAAGEWPLAQNVSVADAFSPLAPLLDRVPSVQHALMVCMQVTRFASAQLTHDETVGKVLVLDAVSRLQQLLQLTGLEMEQAHQGVVWQQLDAYCGFDPMYPVRVGGSLAEARVTSAKLRAPEGEPPHLFVTATLQEDLMRSPIESAYEIHNLAVFRDTFVQVAPARLPTLKQPVRLFFEDMRD